MKQVTTRYSKLRKLKRFTQSFNLMYMYITSYYAILDKQRHNGTINNFVHYCATCFHKSMHSLPESFWSPPVFEWPRNSPAIPCAKAVPWKDHWAHGRRCNITQSPRQWLIYWWDYARDTVTKIMAINVYYVIVRFLAIRQSNQLHKTLHSKTLATNASYESGISSFCHWLLVFVGFGWCL